MAKTIAITGKGGTGKTMCAGLIARDLKEHSKGPVLGLDADPDANLGTVLGISTEMTIGDLREDMLKAMKDFPAGMSKGAYIEAGLHEIIEETEKFDLITMGRSEGPGCYCYINSLLRKFGDHLETSYEWLVMDNEAGMEHISRRTASKIDHLITVVNMNPLSIDCARRIDELASGLKNEILHRHILLNAIDDARMDSVMSRLEGIDMDVLGCIPYDPAVEECIFEGRSLFELDKGPAISKIREIIEKLTRGS